MDTQDIEVRLEDFICRIPALFPYLEWNDDGTVDTHSATDSPNGSYGKVVDNMCMPADVLLINYVQVDASVIPATYRWEAYNTIPIYGNDDEWFSESRSLFLRKALFYRYSQSEEEYEDAVLVEDVPVHISDESPIHIKKMKTGTDGLPIECEMAHPYDFFEKVGDYGFFERKDIIEPCTTYSYRTLISEYYKYVDIVGHDNTFIRFVENGIGKVLVDRTFLNLDDEEEYPEVPDFIYLSQIRTLLGEYESLQKASRHYMSNYIANGRKSATLAKKREKYKRMGGDNMTNWLRQMLQKSYDVANEYKCYADNKDFPARFNAEVMLRKTESVVGLYTVMENEFVPGNRYYDGDLLSYEGRTYICVLDAIEDGGCNYPYVVKTKSLGGTGTVAKGLFMLNPTENGYVYIPNSNIDHLNSVPQAKTKDFIVCDGLYYKWEASAYVLIDVYEYCTGIFDETSGTYVFDEQHFRLLSEVEGYDEWYDDVNTDGKKLSFFVKLDYIPSTHEYDYVMVNESIFRWDEEIGQYVSDNSETYLLSDRTDSKLKTLRVKKNYMSPFGYSEYPNPDEDWLWYYKVNAIYGLIVETDEAGNIINETEDYYGTCYNLRAYGNVILSIDYSRADNSLTFTYVIGGHLIAEHVGQSVDNDGNVIHNYANFAYDENSLDGIRFVETYVCKDSSVSDMGSDFVPFVNGDEQAQDENGENIMIKHKFDKFPFSVPISPNTDGVMVPYANGTAYVTAESGYQQCCLVHEEWEDGLYHRPKVANGLSVDRGNGASYERHIRLGEIRTMEDLEHYQNGGFFKVSEN